MAEITDIAELALMAGILYGGYLIYNQVKKDVTGVVGAITTPVTNIVNPPASIYLPSLASSPNSQKPYLASDQPTNGGVAPVYFNQNNPNGGNTLWKVTSADVDTMTPLQKQVLKYTGNIPLTQEVQQVSNAIFGFHSWLW